MPFLSAVQRRAGRELGSASAVADSKQTLLCTCLSGVLLVGLVLNATLGWSWADPIAALIIAAAAVKCDVPGWCQWVGVSDGTSELGVFAGGVLSKGGVTAVGRCVRRPRLSWGGTPHSAPLF